MADTLLGSEPAADPAAAAAADPAAAAAAAAPAAGADPSKDAPTSGDPAKPAEPNAADGGEPAGKPAEAPAEYAAFSAPDGVTLPPEYVAQAAAVAKELNLPQEAAQKLVDFGFQQVQGMLKANDEAIVAERAKWADQARADTEFGGAALTENLALAKKSLEAFASPALKELLEGSGLGDHPEVVRLFVKVGKAISEDKLVTGNGSPGSGPRSPADVLYGGSNKAA